METSVADSNVARYDVHVHLPSSIVQKIGLGYVVLAAIIVGLSIFTFGELYVLEETILSGARINQLSNAILELRRSEKNYLLYGEESDLSEHVAFLQEVRELLRNDQENFAMVLGKKGLASLQDDVAEYAALIDAFVNTRRSNVGTVIEAAIRAVGKRIRKAAEDMADRERQLLQRSVNRARWQLVLSVVVFSLAGFGVGRVVSRAVSRPFEQLEDKLALMVSKPPTAIHIESQDREVVSLVRTLNHLLSEIELRQRHLVRSEKLASLGTLLAGVAHELNNPLSNISTSSQLLLEEFDTGDKDFQRDLLTQMDEQVERARNIMRSLLEFARDRPFRKETLSVKRLLNDTTRFVRGQVPTHVTLSVEVPESIMVVGDKQRLQQALINLTRNAVEATGADGKVVLSARLAAADAASGDLVGTEFGKCGTETDIVEIAVRDNGVGMDPDLLSHIFDPFFTTKEVGKGSGLGLAIVHEVVEEHDGCVVISSEPNKGTTFVIRLPVPAPRQVYRGTSGL